MSPDSGKKEWSRAVALLLPALALFLLSDFLQTAFAADAGRDPVVIRSVHGDFDSVWEDLNTALANRGLVVSGVSHVGEMLERTGKALGRTKQIFARAKVLEFCSAVVSRDMMEQNPNFIAFCPYEIAVYTLPGDKNKVYLSYRRPIWKDQSGKTVLEEVDKLLDGIVRDVVEQND
jgi:uncharacterized protein (DUF302 family)